MIKFIDTFPTHFFIEMCYNRKNRFGFIYEQNLRGNDFKRLCESYGLFNGCDVLAEQIYEKFCEANEKGLSEFSMVIDNSEFINIIDVYLMRGQISSFDTSSVIDEDNKYNPLILDLGTDATPRQMKGLLMHELTHAYENYIRIAKNKKSLIQKAADSGYGKNPLNMTETYKEKKRMISYILYHLNDFERNAYIAQIKGELLNAEQEFENIDDALNFIRTTISYRNYKTIFKWANQICNETDKYTQSAILRYVSELSNNNFNTYNQFVKWLSNRVLVYQNKFNRIIPKMAAEILYMKESFNNPIDYLIL